MEKKNNWVYHEVQPLSMTIIILCEKKETDAIYRTLKYFTYNLTILEKPYILINYPLTIYISQIEVEEFEKQAMRIVQENFLNIRRNHFLSALIFMIYLKVENRL